MAFWGDYHTHTTYSHGKGSVLENARAAAEIGLKQLAITDHGLRHVIFGIRRHQLPHMIKDCENATKITGVSVLAGVENNACTFDGRFDARTKDLAMLDIIQGGYHKAVWSWSIGQQFSYQFRNLYYAGKSSVPAKLIARNTDAYLKLIDNYDLDFIAHLNRDLRVDAVEVARYAKSKGTFVELNSKKLNITDVELEKMTEDGVLFICNSDAHTPSRVGNMQIALSAIERLHIPYEQIVNWEKLPNFRSASRKANVKT